MMQTKTPEEKNDFIKKLEEMYLDYAVRRNKDFVEKEQAAIRVISQVARGEINYPSNLNTELLANNYFTARDFLQNICARNFREFNWSEKDELIKGYLTNQTLTQQNNYYQWHYVLNKLSLPAGTPGAESFINFLHSLDISDTEITKRLGANPHASIYTRNEDKEIVETCFAAYIKPKLNASSSFLGLKKTPGLGVVLDELVKEKDRRNNSQVILKFLLDNSPESITDLNKYVVFTNYNGENLNMMGVNVLLEHDAEKYEDFVAGLSSKFNDHKDRFSVTSVLAEKFPGKYHEQMTILGNGVLNKYKGVEITKKTSCNYGYAHGGSMDILYGKYLFKHNREEAIKRFMDYSYDSQYINSRFLSFIEEELKEESLPFLINALHKEYTIVDDRWKNYFGTLFTLLDKYDLSSNTEDLLRFGIEKTPKRYRIQASNALAKYIELVTPRAQQLLEGKVNDRIFGAMILQHSEKPEIIAQLIELIDTERSDDTRDIMLDALSDIKFSKPLNKAEVDDMIAKADARKKLNKWGEKWIEEESIPKLYWKKEGKALSEKEMRFLFYRSKRVKGINSDIEAKQVFELLDETRSEKFGLALIKGYQDSNADTKFKYYLVMAGLIGKDGVLNKLHTVFKNTVTSKRYRMAAMTVGAIAMVGSDKALRIVDMIARKFANKRPQIRNGAKEALDAAASELEITMDQLADRIIPNLGFEEHYYAFESGEDQYRAFINKDFKLNYFNEDNKLRKSMPKDVSRETKAELKAIEKEIKEVVKTQKGRLENYLVTERTWEVEEWMEYYYANPIMLIYVQRLLWGVYDENHQLISAFYCDDDLDLYDVDDEEVDVEDGTYIKIVHPLHMSEELLTKWKEKVYSMDKEFEFEIINREVTLVSEEESERNLTKILHGEKIPKGADFVAGFLEKKGWLKSTGDGGYLQFNKINERDQVNAFANIEGPAAYYQGGEREAIIYEVSFSEHSTRQRKALMDLPKVFFSEVIADLKALINN